MIDTIILTLSKDAFHISQPDLFTPSAQWVLSTHGHGITSKQNSTKRELRNGIYKPRLTLSNRMNMHGNREVMLKIELSLPKLLFGNNFDELQQKDYSALTQQLVTTLQKMGVAVTASALSQAAVIVIHYAKNIVLTDGSTPYYYINKIKQANLKLSLDVNQTDYRNDGYSYKWHCNSYEVAFYDKIKDLEKAKQSSKRALEKDSDVQLDIVDTLQQRNKLEILRMEVRLNKRQKMKQLFKELDITTDLTFKGLFKPTIAQKVLLHYLGELESKRPPLLDYKAPSDQALLAVLILNNPQLGPKKILQLYGLKKVCDELNMRELRIMFAKYNQRSWYRLMADANEIKLPGIQKPFENIRVHLMKFKPLKLVQFYKAER